MTSGAGKKDGLVPKYTELQSPQLGFHKKVLWRFRYPNHQLGIDCRDEACAELPWLRVWILDSMGPCYRCVLKVAFSPSSSRHPRHFSLPPHTPVSRRRQCRAPKSTPVSHVRAPSFSFARMGIPEGSLSPFAYFDCSVLIGCTLAARW